MRAWKTCKTGGLLCATVIGAAGCIRPWMDLYIVRDPAGGADPVAYCRLDDRRRLVVTVGNRGDEAAPASNTRITFTTLPSGPHSIDLPTPGIAAGDEVTLPPIDMAALPSSCHHPACRFTIRVDSENAIHERVESDNVREGACPG